MDASGIDSGVRVSFLSNLIIIGVNMKLIDYIQKHYNGNKRKFAIDNNMMAQTVTPMINKGYYHVIDGYLCMLKTELKINEGKENANN